MRLSGTQQSAVMRMNGGEQVPPMDTLWADTHYFNIIHGAALASCGASILASCCTILFLFLSERKLKGRSFQQWTTVERLVIYLTTYDLSYCTAQILDHAYFLKNISHAPYSLCLTFAYLHLQFVLAQGLLALYAAMSACALAFWQTDLSLGRRDWRLLLCTLGLPCVFCTLGVVFGYLGASGAWCGIARKEMLGMILSNINGGLLIAVISLSVLSVLFMSCSRRVGPEAEAADDLAQQVKYHRSAKVMLLLTLAYILRWWPLVVEGLWGMWSPPAAWLFILVVCFVNLGGLFHSVTYAIMRKKYPTIVSNMNEGQSLPQPSSGDIHPHSVKNDQI